MLTERGEFSLSGMSFIWSNMAVGSFAIYDAARSSISVRIGLLMILLFLKLVVKYL